MPVHPMKKDTTTDLFLTIYYWGSSPHVVIQVLRSYKHA